MSTYRSPSRGFALITAMIFLVLLTLVALVALRGSGMEALVSGNNALRAEAFESSESARVTIGDIIDAHVYNRGWPAAARTSTGTAQSTGAVPDSEFGTLPVGFTLVNFNNWYGTNSEDPSGFNPDTLTKDADYCVKITSTGATACSTAATNDPVVFGALAVYKLRIDLVSGTGTAMTQGYDGLGRSAAGGGGNLFFYVKSSGKDLTGSSSTSNYDTSADYRYVIRN